MVKSILMISSLLVSGIVYAQDCTKGQSVTFVQLPVIKNQGTACTVTDVPSCVFGSVVAGGGGSNTCVISWFTPNWIVTQPFTNIGGGAGTILNAPAWMHYWGDGTEADPNYSSGTTNMQGLHYYTNWTVGAGATVNVVNTNAGAVDRPSGALIIISPGTCTIAGAITTNPNGAAGNGGGGGGAGGFGAATGGNGGASNWGGTQFAPGGSGGTNAGTPGTAGASPDASAQKYAIWAGPEFYPMGGANGGNGNAGGSGGGGGLALVLVCQTINLTGTVSMAGAAGGNSTTAAQGGGGGGGGGFFIAAATTYTSFNSGGINVSGGAAGTCTGSCAASGSAGGAGGNGWFKQFTM